MAKARIEVAAAKDLVSLNRLFRRAVRNYGFTAYALGFIPDCAVEGGTGSDPQQPFLLLDWPIAWLELYARQGFAADDVAIAEAAQTTEPFTWSEVRARRPGASSRIFAAAAEFGWGDGFVVPFHDPTAAPGERLAVASLGASDLKGFDPDRRKAVAALAFATFARARALYAPSSRPIAGQATLKEREREALLLVAEGRDDAEIGAILGLSRSGAHFHIENAKKCLGAGTRAQAVAIALTRGLL